MGRENIPRLKEVIIKEDNKKEPVSEIKDILARMAILYINNNK